MDKDKRMLAPILKRVSGIIGNLRCLVKGIAVCVAGPLMADATQPCPPLQVEAVCNAGAVEAVTLRPAQGIASNLSFAVTPQQEGSAAGMQAHLLKSGQSVTLPVKASSFGLAVLGLEGLDATADSACCFSNQQINVAGMCTEAVETEAEEALPDVAVSLEMSENCRDGECQGVVTLSGDVPEHVQLSLSVAPEIVQDLETSDGLSCAPTNGVALCEWSKPAQAELTFKIPRSQPEGVFEVCAEIGVAAAPKLRAMALQTALKAQGFDVGKVDGLVGPATLNALAEMKAAAGIAGDDLLPHAAMTALGLTDFSDANPDNNRICATARIPKPPIVCDKRTTVQSGATCQCRLRNMVRVSERACACPKGTVSNGSSCVRRKVEKPKPSVTPRPKKPVAEALSCDPRTTVQRGEACACRYSGMRKVSATKCRCSNGLPALPGAGCVKVTLSLPSGGDKP